jgi:CubicO group peptidase (beta-lactamase class C family)
MLRLILAGIAAFTVGVQQPPPPPLPASSPAAQRMDDRALRRAVDLYRSAVARDDIRGVVLYVARHGHVVLHEAIGMRHQAYQLPMQKDTLFRMASNTKPVIATAVLMLAEQGKLAVTDPVAKYLPSFDNDKSRRITIAQLLSHTSGFRIDVIFRPFPKDEPVTLQNAVAKFGAEGPAEPAGTYSYSNAGYNTLGAVIEVVSGMSLEAFLKSRIYDPLGMADSLNHEDPTKLARMATVYPGSKTADGKVNFRQGFTPGDPPDFPVIRASGGLISTASDYARFLQMYLDGGQYAGRRLLATTSVQEATSVKVRVDASAAYGFGWVLPGNGVFLHTGSDGTMAWVDPANGIVGMVLTQSPGGINPTAEFRKLVTDACERRQ